MKASSSLFADVRVEVESEEGGHGCLYAIRLPIMSVNGGCWCGPRCYPIMEDVLHVLNEVFRDYHCNLSVVAGPQKVL